LGATAIIIVHNHPSGDPPPASISPHPRPHRSGRHMKIAVHDHVIGSSGASMKALGLI
jgi:DNA repair protein RadC